MVPLPFLIRSEYSCSTDLLNSRGEKDEVLKWNEDMQRWERVWKSSHTASIPRAIEKVFSPLTKGAHCSPPGGFTYYNASATDCRDCADLHPLSRGDDVQAGALLLPKYSNAAD